MDIGRFKRCRAELTMWLLTPLVVAIGGYHMIRAYTTYAHHELAASRQLSRMVPEIESRLLASEMIIHQIVPLRGGTDDLFGDVVAHLNKAASDSNVAILALQNLEMKQERNSGSGLAVIGVGMRCQASLSELVSFLRGLQGDEPLLEVQSMTLRIERLFPRAVYGGELQLKFSHPKMVGARIGVRGGAR